MTRFASNRLTTSSFNELMGLNQLALTDGIELLQQLTDKQYVQTFKPAFASTIGAHFRHFIEHYQCFQKQVLEKQICYDKRERDACLEVDRSLAIEKMELLTDVYCQGQIWLSDSLISVQDQQYLGKVESTVSRELLFLHEHTVHHYAIVAAMARIAGVQPKPDFGVAISTLQHQTEHCQNQPDTEPVGI